MCTIITPAHTPLRNFVRNILIELYIYTCYKKTKNCRLKFCTRHDSFGYKFDISVSMLTFPLAPVFLWKAFFCIQH